AALDAPPQRHSAAEQVAARGVVVRRVEGARGGLLADAREVEVLRRRELHLALDDGLHAGAFMRGPSCGGLHAGAFMRSPSSPPNHPAKTTSAIVAVPRPTPTTSNAIEMRSSRRAKSPRSTARSTMRTRTCATSMNATPTIP